MCLCWPVPCCCSSGHQITHAFAWWRGQYCVLSLLVWPTHTHHVQHAMCREWWESWAQVYICCSKAKISLSHSRVHGKVRLAQQTWPAPAQEWRDAEELLEGTADGAGITGASHGNIEGGGIGGAGVGTLLFDLREAYLEVTRTQKEVTKQ